LKIGFISGAEWKCELRQLDLSVDSLSSLLVARISMQKPDLEHRVIYEGWNFSSGNYLFTTHTK